jgi:hypothetical protein
MTTRTLTPDEETPALRQLPLGLSGLAPTADVPVNATKDPDTPPVYAPCRCGAMVLTGALANGTRLALDTHIKTYAVVWVKGEAVPPLRESPAYPVHRCIPTRGEETP